MRKLVLFGGFVLGNFSILLVALLFLTIYTTKGSTAAGNTIEIVDSHETQKEDPSPIFNFPQQKAIILDRDARAELVDNFLAAYRSPMTGLGRDIVAASDRYQIPFGYLPAIAACEGGLGVKIPTNSFNSWGWGIYGSTVTRFSSWQHAIDTVAAGLSKEYFQKGLDTPEKIMPKYTPPSKGSWAICVNKYLSELR